MWAVVHTPHWYGISIHALLAESDPNTTRCRVIRSYFYPRSPCGERRQAGQQQQHHNEFLSTLSLRRATSKTVRRIWRMLHFYPRSPCGERLLAILQYCRNGIISIHALLAESDIIKGFCSSGIKNFYPRSPCGERPVSKYMMKYINKFLSTLSLRRATGQPFSHYIANNISIHALLAESDPVILFGVKRASKISIHALLAESDAPPYNLMIHRRKFLSTLSLRRATAKVHKTVGHFCAYETNFMEIASSC